jgi:hypothetical protein
MTQDEIINAASKLGLSSMYDASRDTYSNWGDKVLAFAKLVAEAEREECAKLCDSTVEQTYISGYTGAVHSARRECAAAIRARGQA